jgi:simple sugar transport system ATP-binding protein
MVHQHFTSVPAFTVRENLWLAAGRYGVNQGDPGGVSVTPAGRANAGERPALEVSLELLRQQLWAGLDPDARVENLTVGAKQRLEILQSLATGATILLLDEPTAVLAPSEVAELLRLMRDFAAAGGSVVFITHKLGEVIAAVDQVTVLRHGRVTLTGPVRGESGASLTGAMIGENPTSEAPSMVGRSVTPPGASPGGAAPVVVASDGLMVRAREIVGVAAVEGNGQRELLRAVAGVIERPATMTVAEPVAFIPEDRTTEGLIPSFSIAENLVLGLSRDERWSAGPWVRWPAAVARAKELIAEFDVRASGPAAPIRSLSGGNQQKVVFARALEGRPAVLVAENPTRGLDVQATAFVHERIRLAAAAGAGVLLYSADLDEVLELATRVLVMYRGTVRAVASGAGRETIGAMMVGAVG